MPSPAARTILLDRHRLAVAGALALRDMTSVEVIEHTGFDRAVVLGALGDLRAAGLVVMDGDAYRMDPLELRRAAQDAAMAEIPMDPALGYGMTDAERTVLERFFSGRTLEEIPVQRSKRLILLQRLALEFDPGRRYDESEVNAVLGAFHPDRSALRRGLVDEGLLDREPQVGGNLYWRSGGRVTDLPPA